MQDAAEKLGEDATQYKDTPVPMMEATKRIANMWTTMAQLLRSEFKNYNNLQYSYIIFFFMIYRKECLLKERKFKEDIEFSKRY